MIVSLLLPVVLAGVAGDPAAGVLVGVRISGHYKTVAFIPSTAGGFSAVSKDGLLALTDAGPMLVDVVGNWQHVEDDRYLVIQPAAKTTMRAKCLSSPDPGGPGEGRLDVSVVFLSGRYISVARYEESRNGRGWWNLATRRWGQGTAVPMARVLPKHVLAAVDRFASSRRKTGIAEALRKGMVGDADPCWYGDASRTSWGIVRSHRRWVLLAQLESPCVTDWYNTGVPVPGDLVDDFQNDTDPALVSGLPKTTQDLALSSDGGLTIIIEGSSVALLSVKDGAAGSRLAETGLGGWREENPGDTEASRDAIVMLQWLNTKGMSQWGDQLRQALRQD